MEDQTTNGTQYPVARREDLVVEHLGDETLVYDLRNHKAHCLNAGAALVWQNCNGKTDEQGLAAILHDRLEAPQDTMLVEVALQELAGAKLLDTRPSSPKISRREAAKRLRTVFGASVALPAIASIIAPEAAMAASCLPLGSQCVTGGQGQTVCCGQLKCHGQGAIKFCVPL